MKQENDLKNFKPSAKLEHVLQQLESVAVFEKKKKSAPADQKKVNS